MIVDDANKDVFKKKKRLSIKKKKKIQINIILTPVLSRFQGSAILMCPDSFITKQAEVPPLPTLADWLTSPAETETHNLDGAAGQRAANQ